MKTTVAVCDTCRQRIGRSLEVSKDVVTLFREGYLVHGVTNEAMLEREEQMGIGGRERVRGEERRERGGGGREGGRGSRGRGERKDKDKIWVGEYERRQCRIYTHHIQLAT